MKKLACLLAVLVLMVSSTALADEILFRDIPWGSNVSDTLAALPKYSNSCDFNWETRIDSWKSFNADYGRANNGTTPSIFYYGDLQVAGYKVQSISLQFLFSVDENGDIHRNENDLRLRGASYRIQVADIESASADLIEKLTELYGTGESEINEVGSDTITWYGDMGTGICLECSEEYIILWYGRTDVSIITQLDDALAREEAENAKDNVSGL